MAIQVNIDTKDAIAGLNDLQKQHLPFALAKSITASAQGAQQAVKNSLFTKFQLRNSFTQQGIRLKPADKNTYPIAATVYTDTANRATGAPDYLVMQEEGGEKVPHGGRQYLAIPTKYLRQMAPGVIPAELRPRNLLGAVGGRYTAINRRTKGVALRNQRIVEGFVFFIQNIRNGRKAIMGRYFTEREAYPFYLLIPEGDVKPKLQMEAIVSTVVTEIFPAIWSRVWKEIMVRGLRIK